MFKWFSKLTEKLYLKANPGQAVVSTERLKKLEDIANTPIMPNYHVYERFADIHYIPVRLEVSRYIEREEYEYLTQCDNYMGILADHLLQEMMPELVKKILLNIEYLPERGTYRATGYMKFWERSDER